MPTRRRGAGCLATSARDAVGARLGVARLLVAFAVVFRFILASAVVTNCIKILIYAVPIVLFEVLLFEPRPPFFSLVQRVQPLTKLF